MERVLDRLLAAVDPQLRRDLQSVLAGEEVGGEAALRMATARGIGLEAIARVADELRREQAGDVVTYVVNRNINFTNVCIKHCTFCAFSRDHRAEQGYFLPIPEVVRRAREAWDYGATEVCIQAGLPPKMDGSFYADICRAIKRELPDIHIHAFSPEEILYGSIRSQTSIPKYLKSLKEVGLGTLPGTSAEILDPEVRDRIAPGRITRDQWIEVITSAHELGIPTTSTIMYGHVDTPRQRVAHLELLRDIQKQTRGFTEFVPLSFIHQEAPMTFRNLVPEARRGASADEALAMHALGRIVLGATFRNIQSSWVKEGPAFAAHLLSAGANDMGGTLINESISTSAGAAFGQLQSPRRLRALIRTMGRRPAERSTTYRILREFGDADDVETNLDRVTDSEAVFGSYRKLIATPEWRFEHPAYRKDA
ncbi:MAG: 5-amino-6-(D-ribitylamino)uracil--L-tyrosine 4-hydroxyphenyl transferase CofH, partial [Planctomycetota bacterium]